MVNARRQRRSSARPPVRIAGLDSRTWFSGLVALVGLERLVEMRISRRNAAWSRAQGAQEHGAGHYPTMVALHTSLLVAAVAEVWVLDRRPSRALAATSLALVATTMGLRYWVIGTLGHRWNTRVLVLPEDQLVIAGPFRYVRHPNYVAVTVEVAALPLVHSAFGTAVVFTLANAALLKVRIRVEDEALQHQRSLVLAAAPHPEEVAS
jgi:methyltransferase